MTQKYRTLAVFGAVVMATTSTIALAQTTTTDPSTTVGTMENDDDGDEGRWGLLGLLGLAGLLGLKKRDDTHRGTPNSTNR